MILRDYQEPVADKAVEILQQHNIVYLAGEMRTGKTITALTIAERFEARNVLFFTKKKAIADINKAFVAGQFSYNLKVLNYEKLGSFQERNKNGSPSEFRVNDFYNEYLSPDLVILDEAHALGQYPVPANKVKQLQILSLLCPIIFLSGTPTPESFSQLYHQFKVSSFSPFLVWKTFYKWASGFRAKNADGHDVDFTGFVTVKHKYLYNRQINDYSDANKGLIDNFTKHLFITMTQEDAGFEQIVRDEIYIVKMKYTTSYLAHKLIKDRVIRSNDQSFILADTAAKMQQKVHQIFSGTVIAQRQSGIDEDNNPVYTDEPKLFDISKAVFIIERFQGKKLAILYVYRQEYAALLFTFGSDNLTDDPEEFRTSNKHFCAHIRSAREGVDLSAADALIMYNIEFSALSYMQGRQRMQTMDRKTEAVCYWIFADGGIEQKIYDRVVAKLDYTVEYFKKDFLK